VLKKHTQQKKNKVKKEKRRFISGFKRFNDRKNFKKFNINIMKQLKNCEIIKKNTPLSIS
jgi:hypothetical protein